MTIKTETSLIPYHRVIRIEEHVDTGGQRRQRVFYEEAGEVKSEPIAGRVEDYDLAPVVAAQPGLELLVIEESPEAQDGYVITADLIVSWSVSEQTVRPITLRGHPLPLGQEHRSAVRTPEGRVYPGTLDAVFESAEDWVEAYRRHY